MHEQPGFRLFRNLTAKYLSSSVKQIIHTGLQDVGIGSKILAVMNDFNRRATYTGLSGLCQQHSRLENRYIGHVQMLAKNVTVGRCKRNTPGSWNITGNEHHVFFSIVMYGAFIYFQFRVI